jgi:hypothetical protein
MICWLASTLLPLAGREVVLSVGGSRSRPLFRNEASGVDAGVVQEPQHTAAPGGRQRRLEQGIARRRVDDQGAQRASARRLDLARGVDKLPGLVRVGIDRILGEQIEQFAERRSAVSLRLLRCGGGP